MKTLYYILLTTLATTIPLGFIHSPYWFILTFLLFCIGAGIEDILYDDPITGQREL